MQRHTPFWSVSVLLLSLGTACGGATSIDGAAASGGLFAGGTDAGGTQFGGHLSGGKPSGGHLSGGQAPGGTAPSTGGVRQGGTGGAGLGGMVSGGGFGSGGLGGGSTGGSTGGGGAGGGGTGGEAGAGPAFQLLGAPLLFAPTASTFGLNAVLNAGSPALLLARIRKQGLQDWNDPVTPQVVLDDVAQWTFSGLAPSTVYEYEVMARDDGEEWLLYQGSARTQRPSGESFTFTVFTDSHIGPDAAFTNQGDWDTLTAVARDMDAAAPDFMVNLGDMLDFHQFGFNDPPPDGSYTRQAYLNYRALLGDISGHVPHYAVIGNWEGENGDYPPEAIAWSREQRLKYMPNPEPTTYPEGGSANEDYYAFTWGDALFVVLNVMTYTTTPHLLSYNPGVPDDWTLGAEQFAWLEATLKNATSKWRFLLIHHAVGGAGPDSDNAAYGRGGGQAAYVGEQARVHQLMLDHGVRIFFYGHDHVFTDMVVDGIHYAMPGNAGAIWMFTQPETGYTQAWLEPGHGRVDVSPEGVRVQFLGLGNEVIHSFTVE